MSTTVLHLLLTRDGFRAAVFSRAGMACVICHAPAKDVHHVLERRLWPDGGYYVDNGVAVCGECHLRAEQTLLSCEELRAAAKIRDVALPPHLYKDQVYDKWANPILPNGLRLRGELFDDPSVQIALTPVLHLFTDRVKYPRTFHLPNALAATSDDRVLANADHFVGRNVVVTEKMDGECTSIYPDGSLHARSIDYSPHPTRDRVRALAGRLAGEIPAGWRVCGENVFARHSIGYGQLPSFFLAFSIWRGLTCLSWTETKEWFELLKLTSAPVLYEGIWNEAATNACHTGRSRCGGEQEGYVVRLADEFHMREFSQSVAKMVRPNHVQTHDHWMRSSVVANGLCALCEESA